MEGGTGGAGSGGSIVGASKKRKLLLGSEGGEGPAAAAVVAGEAAAAITADAHDRSRARLDDEDGGAKGEAHDPSHVDNDDVRPTSGAVATVAAPAAEAEEEKEDEEDTPTRPRVVHASDLTAQCQVFLVSDSALRRKLLKHRLGIDSLHDFPYPEPTRKERRTFVPDPPPLLLRVEEVYVAALEGLVDEVRVKGHPGGAPLTPAQFVREVEAAQSELNVAHVYRHFWAKGLVISPATKFGGTFMLYKSDRDLEHAHAIVVAKPWPLQLKALETVAMGRLGWTTKKMILYAAYDPDTGNVVELQAQSSSPQ